MHPVHSRPTSAADVFPCSSIDVEPLRTVLPTVSAQNVAWRCAWMGAIVVGASLLSACNQANDSRTAGQKLDAAIATTDRKSEELASDAKAAFGDASRVVARTSKDIAITADVNAALARDDALSPLSINVDTTSGSVLLKGSAPTAQDRERAATIAMAVAGVVAVDNRLQIKPAN